MLEVKTPKGEVFKVPIKSSEINRELVNKISKVIRNKDNLAIRRKLALHKDELSSYDLTSLMMIAVNGSASKDVIIYALLDMGADPNFPYLPHERNLLEYALRRPDAKMTHSLLYKYNVDPNHRDSKGETALVRYGYKTSEYIFDILLDVTNDITQEEIGELIYYSIRKQRDIKYIKRLLYMTSNINMKIRELNILSLIVMSSLIPDEAIEIISLMRERGVEFDVPEEDYPDGYKGLLSLIFTKLFNKQDNSSKAELGKYLLDECGYLATEDDIHSIEVILKENPDSELLQDLMKKALMGV